MATQISSDESSRDDEFDWDSYLVETKSEAAPAENFKQSLIPPVNNFVIGEKLETIDPRNQDSWCIGTIIETDGPRLRIRLDGTDDRNDFWRLVDSSELRSYGTTTKFGGQIVPPLGFQQTSTRWAKYFEKNVKNGPFAAESCFKPQPTRPERNFFRKGQKLEAVDPKHPQFICPATVSNILPGGYKIMIELDGWSSSNNFPVDYYSRDIFPVGWCQSAGIRLCPVGGNPSNRTSTKTLTTPNKANGNIRKKTSISPQSNDSSYSPTTMDEKNNNLVKKSKSLKTSEEKKDRRNSIDFDEHQENLNEKKQPIVTVFLNYTGDNSGIILNPHKFRFLMPSKFGPDYCSVVLTTILDSCVKCTFQPPSFISRIRDLFPTPNEEKKNSFQKIKLENHTEIYVPQMKTSEDFWEVVRTVQTGILAGQDLFISTQPLPTNQSNDSSSSFLDSSISPDKKDLSPLHRTTINEKTKRKSTEFLSHTENRSFLTNSKVPRSNSSERSAHETKVALTSIDVKPSTTTTINSSNGVGKRRPERFTPSEVADFIRKIDPTFENLATRFFQEEIDGKALLLLNTDTLMRHMGLKLGPSLKIVHHIEQLRKS